LSVRERADHTGASPDFAENAIGISTGVLVVCAAVIIKKNRLSRIALLLLAAMVFLGTFAKFSHFGSAFDVPDNGPRYFLYTPTRALVVLVIFVFLRNGWGVGRGYLVDDCSDFLSPVLVQESAAYRPALGPLHIRDR
jgi:hypothetical protein